MNKRMVALIVALFIFDAFSIIAYSHSVNANSRNQYDIIHVGGLGNYSTIQGAINDASPGDTIYVHPGIYYENIFIGKKINLIGEHPLTTIIDGSNGMEPIKIDAIEVAHDDVHISNFTIRNSLWKGAGIDVWTHYGHERIMNCIIYNTYYGVRFALSYNNYITNCTFYSNVYGIWNKCCCGATCSGSLFYLNNFTNNAVQAFDQGTNKWDNGIVGNYWSDYAGKDENNDSIGDEPYNISGGDNKDNYPFINPIDIIPPIVNIIFPNGGERLAGNVTIKWNVSDECDPDPKIGIKYGNDSTTWHTIAEGLNNSGEYEWDTTFLPVGTNYSIRVTAIDASGNMKSDISHNLTIISPPIIEVIRPLQGYFYIRNRKLFPLPKNMTICIGNIDVAVNAFSKIGIDRVEFYLDNSLVETINNESYEWLWEKSFGNHKLKIMAYDEAENTKSVFMDIWKFF